MDFCFMPIFTLLLSSKINIDFYQNDLVRMNYFGILVKANFSENGLRSIITVTIIYDQIKRTKKLLNCIIQQIVHRRPLKSWHAQLSII